MSRTTHAPALWTLPFDAFRAVSKMCWSGMEATWSMGARGARSLGRRCRAGSAAGGNRTGAADDRISRTLARLGVPSRGEVDELTRRVDELAARIAEAVEAAEGSAGESERRVVHVTPDEAGWKVTVEGAGGTVSVHRVKRQAVDAARELARASEPSRVVIHRRDGTIQAHHAYGDDAD